MSFDFRKIDNKILTATAQIWEQQIDASDSDILPIHYFKTLEWARRHANGEVDPDCYVYALTDKGKDNARAILDISHARPKSNEPWLKVLSITVEPRLDAANNPPSSELGDIASHSLVESLGLTFQYPSKQLKVYGNSPLTRDFLEGIAVSMKQIPGLTVTVHGPWLVIDKT